jgi:predicted nucleic acid-binding protein
MTGVDTNVLVYFFDSTEPVKQAKADTLLATLRADPVAPALPWQAVGELMATFRR